MGKSGKLFNTLASVVNSFKSPSKEKSENEKCSRKGDSERKIRKGFKDNRCLWSLGKSSSHRNRDVIITSPFPDAAQLKSMSMKEEKGEDVETQDKDIVFSASCSSSAADPATAGGAFPLKTQNAVVEVSQEIPEAAPPIEASEELEKRDWAASTIQAAFRCYLAKRALQALKALVRLQAIARGRTVRKQAAATLKCMHMLIRVQALARGHHVRKSELGQLVQNHVQQTKQERQKLAEGRTNRTSATQATLPNSPDAVITQQRILVHILSEQLIKTTSKSYNADVNFQPVEGDWVWMWLELWTAAHSRNVYTNGAEDQYDDATHIFENTEKETESQIDVKSSPGKKQIECYSEKIKEQEAAVGKPEEKIKEVVVREYESCNNRDVVEDTNSCYNVLSSMKSSRIIEIKEERITTSVHENDFVTSETDSIKNDDELKLPSELEWSNGNCEGSVEGNSTVCQLSHQSPTPSYQPLTPHNDSQKSIQPENTTSYELLSPSRRASVVPISLSSSTKADPSPIACSQSTLSTVDMDHRSSPHIVQHSESSFAVEPSVVDSQNGFQLPTKEPHTASAGDQLVGCDNTSEQTDSLKEQAVSPRVIPAISSPSISDASFDDSRYRTYTTENVSGMNDSSIITREMSVTGKDDEAISEWRVDVPKDNDGSWQNDNTSRGMNGKSNGQTASDVNPSPEQRSVALKYEQQVEVVSPSIPNYMATTKSSKAKARTVNSPKQKLDPVKLRTDSPRENIDAYKLRADSPKLKAESPKLRTDPARLNKPDAAVKRRHSLSALEGKTPLSVTAAQKPTMHVRANSKGQLNHVNTDGSPGLKVGS